MTDMARQDDSGASLIKQLPEELRKPVALLYAVYSDTLKGMLGLTTRVKLWVQNDGLTVAEAKAVMSRLMRPDRAATIQFPGQLMAALAEEVAAAVAARRTAERNAEDRRRFAAEEAKLTGPRRPAMRHTGGGHAI